MVSCSHQTDCYDYFSSQLSEEELLRAESHISRCQECCKEISHLTRLMLSEESLEEKAFLAANYENSAKDTCILVKNYLSKDAKLNPFLSTLVAAISIPSCCTLNPDIPVDFPSNFSINAIVFLQIVRK